MWNGKKKAVTFSYDDGVTQDRRLVEMMNTYGVKGTFNLNSGMQSYANVWEHSKGLLIHRMNTEGLKELYQGHEIAAHCLTHADLPKYDEETIRNEILEDKKNLEERFGQPVVGMAYPFGTSGYCACLWYPLFPYGRADRKFWTSGRTADTESNLPS